jgi:hypothetical protein
MRLPMPFSFDSALPVEWVRERAWNDVLKAESLVSSCVVVYHAGGHEAPLGGWVINLVSGEVME